MTIYKAGNFYPAYFSTGFASTDFWESKILFSVSALFGLKGDEGKASSPSFRFLSEKRRKGDEGDER